MAPLGVERIGEELDRPAEPDRCLLARALDVVAVTNTVLGRILVDGRGRTLYLFERDKHGTSTCSGLCASEWPPVIASGKPLAGAGAQSSLLGVTKRGDGRLQVTYNHHPLYTFVNDTSKGQTSGEQLNAFGAEWYVLSKAGVEIAKAFPTTNNDGSEPSSGGYGY